MQLEPIKEEDESTVKAPGTSVVIPKLNLEKV